METEHTRALSADDRTAPIPVYFPTPSSISLHPPIHLIRPPVGREGARNEIAAADTRVCIWLAFLCARRRGTRGG